MRRGRDYNAEKRLVTPDGDLLRGEDARVNSAHTRKFYKAAVVNGGNRHSDSVNMRVEQDMHSVAARVSADAAEHVDMRGHILLEHGFCKQSRLVFVAGGTVCGGERQNYGF